MDNQNPIALSVDEAAKLAGLGRSFLYEHLADGSLPSIRVGRRRLIRRAALEDWLRSLENAPASEAAAR